MRVLATFIIVAGLSVSVPAVAGSSAHESGYSVSQERGVTVYRGTQQGISPEALAASRAATQARLAEKSARAANRRAARAIAAQQRSHADLDARISKLETRQNRVKRRSRYGRSYYGNNRFFGRNGFQGNRYYRGASPRVGSGARYRGRGSTSIIQSKR